MSRNLLGPVNQGGQWHACDGSLLSLSNDAPVYVVYVCVEDGKGSQVWILVWISGFGGWGSATHSLSNFIKFPISAGIEVSRLSKRYLSAPVNQEGQYAQETVIIIKFHITMRQGEHTNTVILVRERITYRFFMSLYLSSKMQSGTLVRPFDLRFLGE